MPEYYVKYLWPLEIIGFEPGYDKSYETIDNSEKIEIFITDNRGRVMVFSNKSQAQYQIAHLKAIDWQFKRWATDFKIIEGKEV